MWIVRGTSPFGMVSIRKFLSFLAAVCVASFAYILLAAPGVQAADIEWNGESLMYDQKQYIKQADAPEGNSMGLPAGTHIYSFTEPKQSATSTEPQTVRVLYFGPGTDPATATSATYIEYDFVPPDNFSNPRGEKPLSLTEKKDSASSTKSCVVQGIGWIVCPITNFFASAMDWLFDVLSGFMAVRPVQTDQANALYRAWSYMRNFANVVFVIAFLIIIYSQVTSFGISSYGVKKMLPRLVVAAVFVNISYWICAIAIDISNILGYSIQDIFIAMRNGLVGAEGNSWEVISWESISGFVLSGGTAIGALGFGAYSALAGGGGAIYMLLPILMSVLVAILLALLVLAARQAILTILVIISPLAFVAYILPNTEKYFEKWRELGLTLLIMFPAFSVVFGGSQLAGVAIIQNADSINLIILGMAVQIIPLAITPLLMRLGGGLLNRIAGIVNNPKRGMVDGTRNWAQKRSEEQKARALAHPANRRRDFMYRAAQGIDNRNRKREGWKRVNEAMADNRWHGSGDHHAIDTASREADRVKEILEKQHNAEWNVRARLDTRSMEQELRLRVAADREGASKERLEAMHEEFRAGKAPAHSAQQAGSVAQLLKESDDISRDYALTALRKQAAEKKQKQDLAQELLKNDKRIDGQTLRDYAGGVLEKTGAEAVLTDAIAAERKEYNDNIQNKKQLIKHFNLDGTARQKLAMGDKGNVTATRPDGTTYTFDVNDVFAREAAIETQLSGAGNVKDIEKIIAASGSSLANFKTTISGAIVDYKLAEKASYLSGQTIDDVAQGRIKTDADLDAVATRAIAKGKIKPEHLAKMDYEAVSRIHKVAFSPNVSMISVEEQRTLQAQLRDLTRSAETALTSPSLRGSVAQNVQPILQNIINGVPPTP